MHWKLYTFLAVTAWTLWGVLAKYSLNRMHWTRLEVLSGIAALVIMAVVAPSGFRIKPDWNHALGFMTGITAVAGAIFFYIAVSNGPVSIVVPMSSLYVVGVFLVGVILFGEEWTLRKALGVVFAMVAMFLLASEKG